MENSKILTELGLSDKEAKTYLAILEIGSTTIKPIADRAGIQRTSVYNFIDRLVEQGLVTQAQVRGRMHYQAVSPSHLLEMQRKRLLLIEENIPNFLSLYNATPNKPRIQYFEGAAQMRQALYEEARCNHSTAFLLPTKDLMEMIGVETMADVNNKRVAAGVLGRSLRVRDKALPFPTSAQSTKNLLTVRITPAQYKSSMGVGLYDTGKVGFFSSKNEGFAMMIESQELYEVMSTFYEMLWDMSEPIRAGQG